MRATLSTPEPTAIIAAQQKVGLIPNRRGGGRQITPSTCAQTATIARNNVIDVNASASSATALTMTVSPLVERKENIVR
jgi:hypothetical protein